MAKKAEPQFSAHDKTLLIAAAVQDFTGTELFDQSRWPEHDQCVLTPNSVEVRDEDGDLLCIYRLGTRIPRGLKRVYSKIDLSNGSEILMWNPTPLADDE